MGAVKEEQSVDLASVLLCEVVHYESANVVPDETRAINVQCIQEFDKIVGIVGDGRNIRGLIAISEAAQVRHNHIETFRKRRNILPPRVSELRPAMQQHQGWSVAVPRVVHSQPRKHDMIVFPVGHRLHL
tara:strand:+ start:560 stop:949 length:390 start_codon:yes stop_codon:yes gene_type:complete